jgi:ligand-binding sensor domain-containing protein
MKRTNHIKLAILAALCHCGAAAATEAPKLSYTDEYTNTKDVRDITLFEDKIWIATGGGIAVHDRKDGHFLFKLTSIHGLFGNSVNRLLQSGRGTLIAPGDFGTAEISQNCEAPLKSCFTSMREFSPNIFDPVTDIVTSAEGEGFLGHQSGLYFFEKNKKRAVFDGTGMWRAAAAGPTGILVGGMDGRIMLKQSGASSFQQVLSLGKPVLDLAPLNDGFLIADGTSLVKLKDAHIKPILEGSHAVRASALFSNGDETIVGSSDGGVFEYRNEALSRIADAQSRVTALFADEDTIWIGAANQGLIRLDRKKVALSPSLTPNGEICSNHITRIAKFKGFLIAATFDMGACALKDGVWKPLQGLGSLFVHGVASDGKYLWAATSSGLSRFDENLVNVPIDDTDPKEIQWFKNSAAIALAETPSGFVVGAPWGAVQVQRHSDTYTAKFISHFRGAPEHMTALSSTDDGLLISSETDGVRFVGKNRKSNRTYLDPVHLPEAWILDISPAGSGAFWAASCQSGIAYIENEKAVMIHSNAGLIDNRTVGIAALESGAFVATLSGLSFASKDGTAETPKTGRLPDPRGAMVAVLDSTLYFGTEFGLAVLKIIR